MTSEDLLGAYLSRVPEGDDRVLFQEATSCAKIGAFRAAYVLVWLSCAESIKRRFRDMSQGDSAAGKVTGEVNRRESLHQSIDNYLLDEAKSYGLLTDAEHGKLLTVYEGRCIYGHPYERAPMKEDLACAAANVVELLLSRPLRLRHNYLSERIRLCLEDKSFLDDYEPAVAQYAQTVADRSDPGLALWFVQRLWASGEPVARDPAQKLIAQRIMWLSRAFIAYAFKGKTGMTEFFHMVSDYPLMGTHSLSAEDTFGVVDALTQDTVVARILEGSDSDPSRLQLLQVLDKGTLLSNRHVDRFTNTIASLSIAQVKAAGVDLLYVASNIIAALKTRNWYVQNPAVDVLRRAGPSGIATLDPNKQRDMGRNVLQAADGSADRARTILLEIATSAGWPCPFIEGIVMECFVNERAEVRFKVEMMAAALQCLMAVQLEQRRGVLTLIAQSIRAGHPKAILIVPQEVEARQILETLATSNQPGFEAIGEILAAIRGVVETAANSKANLS